MRGNYKFSFTELAVDLANNDIKNGKSAKDANEVLRAEFLEHIGTDNIDFNTYRKHKYEIFEIIQETITPIINNNIEQAMSGYAEVHNLDWGDTIVFDITNPELFEVAVIADGTGDLRRQRIENGRLPVNVETLGVAIYDEFYRFLAGRINWGELVNKVVRSMEKEIATRVHTALFGAYADIDTEFKYSGSFNEDAFLEVLTRVETLYGSAMIVGTQAAVRKIKPDYNAYSDQMKNERNNLGYVAKYMSYDVVIIPQSFNPGTYDYAINDDYLLILPNNGEKFVKIVNEGTAIIHETQNMQGGQTIEHYLQQKVGVAVTLVNQYGMVEFT